VATTSTDVISQTIIDTILADVNAIVPTYINLVNAHRLLVGSAEETRRIGGVTSDAVARAIERFDRSGALIDILIDLLCCKIVFSSEFLAVTCAPVDIFRLLANRFDVADAPHMVAEEILVLELIVGRWNGSEARGGAPCTPREARRTISLLRGSRRRRRRRRPSRRAAIPAACFVPTHPAGIRATPRRLKRRQARTKSRRAVARAAIAIRYGRAAER
jgi:hypothetical protein